jgi:hypothetical protein
MDRSRLSGMDARPSVLSALTVASLLACQGHAAAHEPPVGTRVYTQGALLAVRTTRGLVLSRDPERHDFRLLCNEAMSVAEYDAPSVIVREDGSLLIGASQGLLRVSADLCSIEPVRAFERVRFSALVPDPHDARHLFAATSIGLYESRDAGETFAQLDANSFDSLEVPADEHDLVYATGQRQGLQGEPHTYFARWQSGRMLQQSDFVLAQSEFGVQLLGSDKARVFAVAHAYLGTQVLDRLLVSSDDAKTWQSPLSAPGIAAFALEPDTGKWLVGSERGLWRLDDAGRQPLQLRSEAVSCLDTTGPAWLMCEAGGVSRSTDAGAHWSSVLRWTELRGLAECPQDAPAVQLCQVAWADWQLEMPAVIAAPDAGAPDAAAAPDAGALDAAAALYDDAAVARAGDAAAALQSDAEAARAADAASVSGNELPSPAHADSGCAAISGTSSESISNILAVLAAWLWLTRARAALRRRAARAFRSGPICCWNRRTSGENA